MSIRGGGTTWDVLCCSVRGPEDVISAQLLDEVFLSVHSQREAHAGLSSIDRSYHRRLCHLARE